MKGELEDWLSELPPLDGADDEPDANESIVDDALPSLDEDSSLDDAAADDLEVDETVDIAEEESSDGEDDDRWEADVGEPELDLDDAGDGAAGELDSPALGDGDFDLDDDLPTSEDDLGEEGTTDPIEHSLDETLPALDADEEGDFEDALLLEAGLTFPQGEAMRWASIIWQERSSSSRSLAWAVPDDLPVAMVVHPLADLVAAITRSGKIRVSRDGGMTVLDTSAGQRQLKTLFDEGGPSFAAFSKGGALWIADRSGRLAKSVDFGHSWASCPSIGRTILAFATHDDGSLSVLARKAEAVELLTSTHWIRWFAQPISAHLQTARSPVMPSAVWLVHRAAAVAIGDDLGVLLSRDGRHFARVPGSAGAHAAAFACTSSQSPLLFTGTFG